MSYLHSKKFIPGRVLPKKNIKGSGLDDETVNYDIKITKIPCLLDKKIESIHPNSAASKISNKKINGKDVTTEKIKKNIKVKKINLSDISGQDKIETDSQTNEVLSNIRKILLDTRKLNRKRKQKDVINF